ncbi:MAG: LysM peptidoglycan-binding domain-containing protein [Cyanobium sp.]|nr:LysM peptidoglycan-binding domain-containing protein [Cyanobium sp.]
MRTTLAALVLGTALPLMAALPPATMAQQAVVVRSGETLSEIADRHGVSLTRLMQANGISDPDLVQVGQRITIPGSGAPRAAQVSSRAGGSGSTYTIRDGETLSEIADRNGISLSRLMQANGIANPDLVQVGQRLTIPGRGGSSGSPRAAAAGRPSTPTAPYTVKSGETLSEIAARFDTSAERLIQINAIRDPDLVMSGTRLQVPVVPERRSSAAAPAKATGSTQAAVNRQAREHTVEPGESLSLIAERYGTSVERLAALNQLEDPALLQVGTRLKLRGTPPAARPVSSSTAAVARSGGTKPATPATGTAPASRPAITTDRTTATKQPAATPSIPATATAGTTPAASTATATAATAGAAATSAAITTPTASSAPVREISSANATAGTAARAMAPLAAGNKPAAESTAVTDINAAMGSTARSGSAVMATNPIGQGSTAASSPLLSAGSTAVSGAGTRAQATASPITSRLNQATSAVAGTSPGGTTAASTVAMASGTASPSLAAARTASPRQSLSTGPLAATPAPVSRSGPATASGSGIGSAFAASSRTTQAAAGSSAGDWRSYGPLQVDWSKLQPMGGSFVAPTVNGEGQALYVAVNCTARKINVTSQAGQWKTWESPGQDFEQRLVQDICLAKAG